MADLKNAIPAGADYELRTERTKSNTASFDGNKFERINSTDNMQQTIRVLHNGKISTAGGSKPGSAADLAAQAAAMAKYGSPHDVAFVGKTDIAAMNLVDNRKMSSKEMIDLLGGLVEELRKLDPKIVVGASLSSTIVETAMKTGSGFDAGYEKSFWGISASVELMQGEDLLAIYESKRTLGPDFDLKKLIADITEKLEHSRKVVPFEAGAYPVIFTPGEVIYICNPVLASLNGTAVYRKVSPWSEKLGEQLLDPRFSLIDDATIDKDVGSKPFDLEGTPTQRLAIVENGAAKNLYLNRKVAQQLGKESTGNAGPMGPTTNYIQLAPGSKTAAELIKSIDKGLIIDGSMGAWSGNPYSGIVTGTISQGLKVEGGKIVGRVKDCMFTVNAFEHLKNHLVDLSSDRELIYGSAMLPHLMLNEVVISTK